MTRLGAFTLELLTNNEAIDVKHDQAEVWVKPFADGSKAVGLFNRGDKETEVVARWADLQIPGKRKVRDLKRHSYAGVFDNEYRAKVPPHGLVMVRIANGPK